ncbi:MAG: hypothetical protein ACI4M3_02910 [Acutalibacteraceae bacterium]
MFTFETTIKDQTIKASAQQFFKNAVGALFQILKKASEQHDIFDPNFALGFGFSYFFLVKRKENDFYEVATVNYRKNPFNERTTDLTIALIIHNMQSEMIATAKVQPLNTFFRQSMIVLRQAAKADEIYLTRTTPTDDSDSGWYLGLTNDEHEDDHQAEDFLKLPVCELIKMRPVAMRALAMPVGTLVTISKNDITAVVDENDNPIPFTPEEELRRREQEGQRKLKEQLDEAVRRAKENKAVEDEKNGTVLKFVPKTETTDEEKKDNQ